MFVCFPELLLLFFSAGVFFVDRLDGTVSLFFPDKNDAHVVGRYHKSQAIYLESKDNTKISCVISSVGTNEVSFSLHRGTMGSGAKHPSCLSGSFPRGFIGSLIIKKASDVCLFIVLRHSRFSESSKSVHSS